MLPGFLVAAVPADFLKEVSWAFDGAGPSACSAAFAVSYQAAARLNDYDWVLAKVFGGGAWL